MCGLKHNRSWALFTWKKLVLLPPPPKKETKNRKLYPSYLPLGIQMSAAQFEVMCSGAGNRCRPCTSLKGLDSGLEEAPTCVCPAVSPRPVQDEIIHQSSSEETLWSRVQRHANDKSMFVQRGKPVSSELIENGRTEVRANSLYLYTIRVESLQMSRNWWFCSTRSMHYVTLLWLLWISSVQFCSSCWII